MMKKSYSSVRDLTDPLQPRAPTKKARSSRESSFALVSDALARGGVVARIARESGRRHSAANQVSIAFHAGGGTAGVVGGATGG